jgi:hypothetical protein
MTGAPPPPPPPVVPFTDVEAVRTALGDAQRRVEATLARAATYTEDERQQRVDGEWSAVESLRHLVLVLDLWLARTIQGVADPFHPMALPPSFMPPALPGTSIDPDARPSFDEASEVVRSRFGDLARYVDGLTDEELTRPVEAHARTVGGALRVIFTELAAHDGFMNRDLGRLRS